MIIFILISYALSKAITTEYVFKWFRKLIWKLNIKPLYKLISCPNCISFWIGVGLYFVIPVPSIVVWLNPIIYGLISYGTNKLINTFLSDREFTESDGFDEK